VVLRFRSLARKGDGLQADAVAAADYLRSRSLEQRNLSGEADASILLLYWPLARLNNFQGLLYSQGWSHGVASAPVADFEAMGEVAWEGPMACHFHWLAAIDSEVSLQRFKALLTQLKDQGRSIIWTVHNVLPHDETNIDLAVRVRRVMVEAADLVHIMNVSTPEIVAPYFSLAGKRIFHSPHPSYLGDHPDTVSREEARFELGLRPETTVFLSFGSIQPYKGLEELVAAAQELARDRPDLDWALVIAGGARDKEVVRRILASEGLGERLLFVPQGVQVRDVQYFFRAADYCALPYRTSLNSGAAMLGLSFGVPIVAPETDAFAQILELGAGIGYAPGEAGALAAAMATAVEADPAGMRSRALAIAEERSPPKASAAFFAGLRQGLRAAGLDRYAVATAPSVASSSHGLPVTRRPDLRGYASARFLSPDAPAPARGTTSGPPDPQQQELHDSQRRIGGLNDVTWQGKWVAQLAGFKEATNVLEIGAGGFATTLSLAKQFPAKHFFALDFVLSAKALSNLADTPPNVSILKHDARDLGVLGKRYFDFAFSVAVMEHIRELAEHLDQMQRIISKDGYFWFWEAPFWSSSMGHHYRHSEKDCPIPHYAHLYMPRPALGDLLIGKGLSPERSEQVLAYIYDRGDLARLTRTETIAIINDSAFRIVKWEDDADPHYSEAHEADVMANNLYAVSAGDLRIKGAKACLRLRKRYKRAAEPG
jgi:glycosyltransferase involved in cell wall biosynthesis/SAM-dependent methyltransferase